MSKIFQRKNEERIWFSPEQRNHLNNMFKLLDKALVIMQKILSDEMDKKTILQAYDIEAQINQMRDFMRKDYLVNVETGEMSIKTGLIYNNLFSYCEEIGDKLQKIAESAEQSVKA